MKLRLSIFVLILIFSIPVFSQVKVTSDYSGSDVVFDAIIDEPGSYTIELKFTELSGYRASYGRIISVSYPYARSIYRLKREGNGAASYNYTYRVFQGRYNVKPDIDYPYLLPVKAGKNIVTSKFTNLNYSLRKTTTDSILGIVFNCPKADTIYAIRSGYVIKTEGRQRDKKQSEDGYTLYDQLSRSITTVEHKDGTMARYVCASEADNLLKPGDRIIAGQPIAVLTNKSDPLSQVGIRLYYLDKELKYATLLPKFYTEEGLHKLEFRKEYHSASTEEIITKELSKKEKKKLNFK